MFNGTLADSLALLAAAMRDEPDAWWIIGSAGAAMVGAAAGEVRDIDVLTTPEAAGRLASRLDVPLQPRAASTSRRFRSYFARCDTLPMPVEVMGGLQLLEDRRWTDLVLSTRVERRYGPAVVFVPDIQEQIAIFRRFGRRKDEQRALALMAVGGS